MKVNPRSVTAAIAASLFLSTLSFAQGLSSLSVWDDGMSEMCYYEATDTIYGKPREYTRVQLLNRQWMHPAEGVKADPDDPGAVPVFKFSIAEEIPTENYNYRYVINVFLRRPELTPFKEVLSSQEWCGTTYKHLRWSDEGLKIRSFSYFDDEGDREFELKSNVLPFESVFVLARDVVARNEPRSMKLLPSMRSNRQVIPDPTECTLSLDGQARQTQVPAGTFEVRRVKFESSAGNGWLEVEAAAPYRLMAFSVGGVEAKLRFVERRAYWDHQWESGFYPANEAP